MKVIANNSRSTLQLLEIELSMAYLYRALRCKDFDSDSIYCRANVYLAVLYYTTGQYQKSIDHCTEVTRSQFQDHSQYSSHVVQGEFLPRIDDNTDNVLGLAVFYQYMCTAVLKQQQQQQQYHVSVFNAETFAHYLYAKSLSPSVTGCCQFTQSPSTDEIARYGNYVTEMRQPLHAADLLLFKAVNRLNLFERKLQYKAITERNRTHTRCTAELNAPELVEFLQKFAVEHLTVFQQLVAPEFQSILPIATTDFDALYAYKRGEYEYCLLLSIKNARKLLRTNRINALSIFPEFIQLLDDDIVSLTAVTLIINPKCRDVTGGSRIDQLTLSLYLMTQCQLKLGYSPTQLNQTLDYIVVGQRTCPVGSIFNHSTLMLIKCKLMRHLLTISSVKDCM